MTSDLLSRLGALTLAAAAILAPGAAVAAVYDFQLTGVVANGAYSGFGQYRFYDLDLSPPQDFQPFQLEIGDVLNLTITLDTLLNVTAATDTTFFGVDILTDTAVGYAPNDGTISSSTLTPLDGSLFGNTYFSGCSNCISGTAILSPGPVFNISQFTTSITIDDLVNATAGDTSPFVATGFRLRYQNTDSLVPEPATWAMMILGFGAVGGMVRRRRGLQPA